jgi:hypothetical protein
MSFSQYLRGFLLTVCLVLTTTGHADWKSRFDSLLGGGAKSGPSALSNQDVVAGLKEALDQGARRAVDELGQTNGFLSDARVRIPMPPELERVESTMRTLRQDRYVDEFVVTMNRAAEAAVPEASAILGDAIRQMTVNDANQVLNGPDDAATQYFRRVSDERLTTQMRPIVSEATSQTGVTSSYKALMDKVGFAAKLAGADSVDIDGYVTEQALDGLFLLIAQEEKRIRDDPLARSTDLLKLVFGSGQ